MFANFVTVTTVTEAETFTNESPIKDMETKNDRFFSPTLLSVR